MVEKQPTKRRWGQSVRDGFEADGGIRNVILPRRLHFYNGLGHPWRFRLVPPAIHSTVDPRRAQATAGVVISRQADARVASTLRPTPCWTIAILDNKVQWFAFDSLWPTEYTHR